MAEPTSLVVFFIFIRCHEKATVALFCMNPHLFRSCRLPSFPVASFIFSQLIFHLQLVRSHQAEIIVVKRLIQGRNNATRVVVELRSRDRDYGHRKNGALTLLATLPTQASFVSVLDR